MMRVRQIVLGCMLGLSLSTFARADETANQPYDPLENVNRATFALNDVVDMVIVNPLVSIWNAVLPQPVRQGVNNVFDNLDDVYAGVNHALQGRGTQAGTDFSRVLVNTTVGVGGLFDVGTKIGLKKSYGDFGQTLGVWGFSTGPYVVLPLLGPSTLRETAGRAVRVTTDARNLLPTNTYYALTGTEYLATRADAKANEGLIAASSLDRYVFVRNLYWQRRSNLVQEGRQATNASPQP
ncbi:MAG: VacJ family lipoprotein [Hyphomicrobiales bacterium]